MENVVSLFYRYLCPYKILWYPFVFLENMSMLTYGMTLDDCHKRDKKCPVLFNICSGEPYLVTQLKGLICCMTAHKSIERPDMKDIYTTLVYLM